MVRDLDSSFDCFGKVKIGSNVYIGNNTLVMPGVIVGDNVLKAVGRVSLSRYQVIALWEEILQK